MDKKQENCLGLLLDTDLSSACNHQGDWSEMGWWHMFLNKRVREKLGRNQNSPQWKIKSLTFAQAYSILPDVIMDLEQHLGSKESAPFRVKSRERITESNLSI